MKTVLIAGGTGTIGRRLTQLLKLNGYKIIVLTRDIKSAPKNELCDYASWNPAKEIVDKNAIAAADFIVNLAGAGIAAKRWTLQRKKIIVESRVNSCKTILQALRNIENRVKAVINASATGFYGPDDTTNTTAEFVETDAASSSFLGQTCEKWEAAIAPVKNLNKRLVILRTGVVLDLNSGMYNEFKTPLRFRIAAVLGKGTQMISWIHIDDICRSYLWAIEKEEMRGVYNVCAPNPVTIKEVALTAAKYKYGKNFLTLKMPAFLLKSMLGEMAEGMLLNGTTVSAQKLLNTFFTFKYVTIHEAIENVESKS